MTDGTPSARMPMSPSERQSGKTPSNAPTSDAVMTLLVVEDEDVHQELIANVLAGDGPKFNIVFAESVQQAMDILSLQRMDCVLLDHNLRDGLGTQLLTKAEHLLHETPVLSFSTSTDPNVALSEFQSGCNAFVLKRDAFKGHVLREQVCQTIEKFRRRCYRQALSNHVRKLAKPH